MIPLAEHRSDQNRQAVDKRPPACKGPHSFLSFDNLQILIAVGAVQGAGHQVLSAVTKKGHLALGARNPGSPLPRHSFLPSCVLSLRHVVPAPASPSLDGGPVQQGWLL